MKKVEASITIERPVEPVFAFISNAENNPKWATGAIAVKKVTALTLFDIPPFIWIPTVLLITAVVLGLVGLR